MIESEPAPLIVMVGLPGSGKSTWAQRFIARRSGYCVVATDDIRAQLYGSAAVQGEWLEIWRVVLRQLCDRYHDISTGEATGVIYDATNVRRRHRREFIQSARACGYAPVVAVWIDTPLVACLERNLGRSRRVPTEVIEKMHRQLTAAPPTTAEALDYVYRIAM
ncbi:MAG: AAA family ATPase [Phormidesmis sp.]